jgi:hypothetical protein
MLYLGKKDPGPVTTVVRLRPALTHFLLGHTELLFPIFVDGLANGPRHP